MAHAFYPQIDRSSPNRHSWLVFKFYEVLSDKKKIDRFIAVYAKPALIHYFFPPIFVHLLAIVFFWADFIYLCGMPVEGKTNMKQRFTGQCPNASAGLQQNIWPKFVIPSVKSDKRQ